MIERRAEACHTDTTKYLRKMVLEKQPIFYDFSELAPMVNGMRIISGNINQIAKKVNATNNIYAEDVIVLKKEVDELCRISDLYLSNLQPKRV
ncbi:plasmid mobilization relaxosome protein MobC [Ruminococcus sp.]|uniref:plasmid mobilization protein n=1 Tax=Ruminococcus sp. TaxID=41978 RepID=UPI0025EE85D9|nr:plasmid mobilization relaxosome protein MobC [Ruminococcus sp.]